MNIEPGFGADRIEAATADDEAALARKRKIIIIVSIIALVVVGLFAIKRSGTSEPASTQPPPAVTVVVPGTQQVARTISATGTLAARREMPVGVAGDGGMIARVLVEPGDWVKAGQTLATIEASVEVQQANQLRAQIAAARADAVLADSELQRSQSLVGRGFVSKADVERKQATRDGARARVGVAQAQLGEMSAKIGRLDIRAPAGGLVLARNVEPGQVVSPGSGALFRMAKAGEMELKARVSEGDLAQLSVGDKAAITPVGSSRTFQGEIWQISPVIDPQSRQGEARILLRYDSALRPGGFAAAMLRTGTAVAPLLPESAVLSDEKGNFVYIVGPDNKVSRRSVKVGQVSDAGLAITSGLTGREKIVVSAGGFPESGRCDQADAAGPHQMNFRQISAWAIKNPVGPLVLFAALMLAGVVSFIRMDINQNPDIDFPAAQVIVIQPGAAPSELENQVTQRIEAAVRGISGVDEISSTITEGQSSTFVQFVIGTPVDRAVNDVRNAVSQIRSELPQGILEPQITRVDIAGDPIAYFSVEAVDMTIEDLSWYVDNTVAKRLLGISGMARVTRGGGVDREIRVILDPRRLQAQGITAAQVNAQLIQMNVNATGGRAEIAGAEQSVRVIGNAQNAHALGEKLIFLPNGSSIKLSDIADVRDLYAEQRKLSKMNNRQVLSIGLEKAKGSSDVTVFRGVKKALAELQKENPKVHFTQLFTSVDYTLSQYHSAMSAMVEGAILAVMVVFVFLRDWRATLISAIAIPLSAIPAFWFMDLMGFTLNGLSLLALSLVAGVLVDDAIVEIENIVRHMRMGKSAWQASIDAADEIGLAVLATTMAIVAVFLPVGLMPGITGQFFKNFGLTIVAAVLVSLAVARLITPLAAAYFLKPHGEAAHASGPLMEYYLKTLRWTLEHRWKTVMAGAVTFLLTIVAFATLPFTFQPNINSDYSQLKVEMVPGTTLEQTTAAVDQAVRLLNQSPAVNAAFADINVGTATVFVTLNPDRPMSSNEFERSFIPKLQNIPDARINFQSLQNSGGRDIIIMLVGDDPDELQSFARKASSEMRAISQIRFPRVEGDLPRPEIMIRPRFDLASELGVSTAALSETIRIATIGDIDQNVAKFSLSDRQIPIRVALEQNSRTSLSTLENLPVPTANGGSVPLKLVADIGFGAGPSELRRYNQSRRVIISADLSPGVVSSDAMKAIDALPAWKAMPASVKRVPFGDSKWQAEMAMNFAVAVVSGILLVFAVLVLLYKRFLPPFVNMGSLLLAPLGSAIALHLTGNAVSLPVLIGVLMLLGIVSKNSILLVDFAIEEMNRGADLFTAIMEAGHKRAQPIVMTTVAMVAGMIPISLSLTGDGSWRAPMGITVMGGLILSTVLTLLIVPASFSLTIQLESKLGPYLRRYLTTGGEKTPHRAPQPAE